MRVERIDTEVPDSELLELGVWGPGAPLHIAGLPQRWRWPARPGPQPEAARGGCRHTGGFNPSVSEGLPVWLDGPQFPSAGSSWPPPHS